MNVMGGDKLNEWRRSGDEELSKLIVTEERARWIEKRYPPSDQGRPGILHVDPRGSKRVRETDDDPADEGALADAGEELVAVEQGKTELVCVEER